jgi:hypothetical protein
VAAPTKLFPGAAANDRYPAIYEWALISQAAENHNKAVSAKNAGLVEGGGVKETR